MPSNPPLSNPPPATPQKRRRLDRARARLHPLKRVRAAAYARQGLGFAGKLTYTQGPSRSELFHRKPGRFSGASADCSQYVSSCLHWSKVKRVTDSDWTGTLYTKGKPLGGPRVGAIIIFGETPGVHVGMFTGHQGNVWMVTGFGHQGAPDAHPLGVLLAYFQAHGHSGYSIRDLTA